MGGSRPSAPTTYIPAPATPRLYISTVPEKDYERAADLISRTEQMRQDLIQQRYKEVGTPEELGERQAGIRAQEAASYAASLPQGDRYLADITGVKNQYRPAIEQADARLTQAQADYGRAIAAAEDARNLAPEPSPEPSPEPAPPDPEPKTYSKFLGDFGIKKWDSRDDAKAIVDWYNQESGKNKSVRNFKRATGVDKFDSKQDARKFLRHSLNKLNRES